MSSNSEEPKGIIGRTYKDGLPVIWKFVNEEPTLAIKKDFPRLVVITWSYDGSTNNGMPLPAENQRMVLLEQAIADEIEKTDSCRHAISRTGSNLKELIYYVRNYDHFIAELNSTLRSHERYPIEIEFYEDPDWTEHEDARLLFTEGEHDGGGNSAALRASP